MSADRLASEILRHRLTRRRMLGAVAVTAAGISIAGCRTEAPAAAKGVTVDISLEPRTINGLDANNQYIRWVLEPIQETLYTYDDKLNLVPVLAAELPKVVNETTTEVKIKSGISFHNGDPLTAEHVAVTFNEARQGTGRIWGRHLAAIQQVDVVDNSTVRFVLKRPWGRLLDRLDAVPIMHKDYVSRKDAIMGTGPYAFVEHKEGAYVKVKANPQYRDGAPKVPEILYRFVPESGARLVNLVRGDSQILPMPGFKDISVLKNDPNITVVDRSAPITMSFWLNCGRPPFDDIRVRQALAYSMNRAQVRDVNFAGYADIAHNLLVPGQDGFEQAKPVYGPDPEPERATSLLRSAGIPEGKPVEFTVLVFNEEILRDVTAVLQSNWAKVGLKANLEFAEPAVWSSRWQTGNWDICCNYSMDGYAYGTVPDLLSTVASDSNRNFGKFMDEEFTALIHKADATLDRQERSKLWAQAAEIASQKAALVPPVHPRFILAHRKELKGLPEGPLTLNRVRMGGIALG